MSELLTVKNLSAGYYKKTVINNLSLPPLKAGEVVVLTGPNAAGKSTLLRAISGLVSAKGDILYNNINLKSLPLRKRATYMSFMPQHVPADIDLSVIEAVISSLKASPIDAANAENKHIYDQAFAALEKIGISHLAMEPINHLSGGQRQMASLARTIVRNPKILLLDEPTSALDLQHQVKVMKLARTFAAEGKIVVIVLHDLNLALRWSDKVVIMNKGNVVSCGTPQEAITPQLVTDVYGVCSRVEACSRGFLQIIVD